jgi:hypothetical protein
MKKGKTNITNQTKSESIKKFKPQSETLLSRFIKTNKNIKSFKFWFYNILSIFFFIKTIQLFLFMKEFSYSVPKEQMKVNMMNINTMRNMKPDVLHKYLDDLEKQKEERKKKYLN